jgi:hypothetical protein
MVAPRQDKLMLRAKSNCLKDRHLELAYLEQIPSRKDKTSPGKCSAKALLA